MLDMCPLCDGPTCSTWKLQKSCFSAAMNWIFDNDCTLYYSIFMTLWASLFLEFWKREQFKISYEWDLFNTPLEIVRPQWPKCK